MHQKFYKNSNLYKNSVIPRSRTLSTSLHRKTRLGVLHSLSSQWKTNSYRKLQKMGRLFLVDFEFVPVLVNKLYRCRTCFVEEIFVSNITYVAHINNQIHEDIMEDDRYSAIIIYLLKKRKVVENLIPAHFFMEVVNVTFGEPIVKAFFGKPGILADIYCNRCNKLLGWKIIESFKPKYKFLEGVYALDRTKLHLWSDEDYEDNYTIGLLHDCVCP